MRRFFGGGDGPQFKRNDVVRLKEGAPFASFLSGSVGLVTSVYGGGNPSYEVEFVNASGEVLDRLVVKETHLSPVADA